MCVCVSERERETERDRDRERERERDDSAGMATELQRPPRVSLKGSVPRGRRGAARAAGNLALGGMAAEDFDVVDEVSQQRPHLDRVRVIASRGWCACLWGECVPICLGVHECVWA